MRKRSKLDLSPGTDRQKPQAAGFEPEVAASSAETPADETLRKRGKTSAEPQYSATVTAADSAGASRALVVTSMVVVAAAAAVWFLLKKR